MNVRIFNTRSWRNSGSHMWNIDTYGDDHTGWQWRHVVGQVRRTAVFCCKSKLLPVVVCINCTVCVGIKIYQSSAYYLFIFFTLTKQYGIVVVLISVHTIAYSTVSQYSHITHIVLPASEITYSILCRVGRETLFTHSLSTNWDEGKLGP